MDGSAPAVPGTDPPSSGVNVWSAALCSGLGARTQPTDPRGEVLPFLSSLQEGRQGRDNQLLCHKNGAFVPSPWHRASKNPGDFLSDGVSLLC